MRILVSGVPVGNVALMFLMLSARGRDGSGAVLFGLVFGLV